MERDLTIPNVLLIKCETSGLYRDDLSMDDEGQPFAMEIAALLCTKAGATTSCFSHVIHPQGRRTQANALKIHGISDRAASQIGISESRVLGLLSDMLKTPVVRGLKVVSYSDFDPKVISSLFARFAVSQGKGSSTYDRLWYSRPLIEFVTMQSPWCQQLCKLPDEGDGGEYRRPTLDEAGEIILDRPKRLGLHDALSGLFLLRDLYWHFDGKGYFEEAA